MCFGAAYAEKISENAQISDVSFSGVDVGLNSVYIARVADGEEYLVDGEKNIVAGPFEYIADYGSFPLGVEKSGAKTLFDHNGDVLAKVEKGFEVFYPKNGIYAVGNNEDCNKITDFKMFDYETRKELCHIDFFVDFSAETQTEKMFTEKNGKWALINKYGELLTDFVYDDVKKKFNPDYYPYPKAYAIVVINGEEKYIDWNLNEIDLDNYGGEPFVTNCTYLVASGYDYKRYYIYESGEKTGIFDSEENKFAIPYQTEYKFLSKDGNFITVEKNGKQGVINIQGEVVLPFEYNSSKYDDTGYWWYTKDEKSGYYDINRSCEITENGAIYQFDGIFVDFYSEYTTADGYSGKQYSAKIINAAGHNLTGEIYHPSVNCADGKFYRISTSEDEEIKEIFVPRDFAVIKVLGKYLDFDGIVKNNRTLVPVREITQALGGEVFWNESENSVKIFIGGKEIYFKIGSNKMVIDGEEKVLDTAPQLIENKTMVPLRALSEAADFSVDWDEKIKCVYIN